jgi:hypothetical protein
MPIINLKNVFNLLYDEFKISKVSDTPIIEEEIKLKTHLKGML